MIRRAHGLRAWIWQRTSAVYMVAYLLYFGLHLAASPVQGYPEWRAWMAGTFAGLATGLFFAALLVHSWVGIRDVILDYAHPPGLRYVLLTLAALGLIGSGLWFVKILYGLS